MDNKLLEEAKALGINASMYNLLPKNRREDALRKDVVKAKERRRTSGQN